MFSTVSGLSIVIMSQKPGSMLKVTRTRCTEQTEQDLGSPTYVHVLEILAS